MASRTPLEQEFFEQFRAQGLDEYSASDLAREWAIDQGEYDAEPNGSDRADLNSLPATPDPLSVGNSPVDVLTHPGGSALNDSLDSERFGVLNGAHSSILAQPKPSDSEAGR